MENNGNKTTSVPHENNPQRGGDSWKPSTPPPSRQPSKPQPK